MLPTLSWTTAVVVVLGCFLLKWFKKDKSRRSPPGPRALPIIGHLHLLGKNPHHIFCKLSKKYGPVMSMRFGFYPYIIISSSKAAEQILKTNDRVFANRPDSEACKYASWEQKGLTFGKYGPYWREMRKLCTLELLSNRKVNSFQAMRREELHLLVDSLRKAAHERVPVDLSSELLSMSADMSSLMILGKKTMSKDLDDSGLKAIIQEGLKLVGTPNLGDYFPYLRVFDLQGLTRRLKAVGKEWDQFFEKILVEHAQSRGEVQQNKDFVDTIMDVMESGESGLHLDRCHVKAILQDMLVGSMDTTATSIEWVLSELIKRPNVMKKVQRELEEVVGMERMVEESDLEKLPYLDMVMKESFRLHPIAPFLAPHEAMEDCIIDGYHIPKYTRVIVNTWTIGRDPNDWKDPEKFFPERFSGSTIDVQGQDFQLLPFGSGRRGCPGMQLGLIVVKLVVAQLVHCFNWDLPNEMQPKDLDMTEEFSLLSARKNHLLTIPTYRLKIQ